MSKEGKKTRIQTISQAELVSENLRASKGLALTVKVNELFAKNKKGPGKHIIVKDANDKDVEIYKTDIANAFKAARDQFIKNASVRIKNTRARQLGGNQKSTTNFTKGIVYVGNALRNFIKQYGSDEQYNRVRDGYSTSTEVQKILRAIFAQYKEGGRYDLVKIDGISDFGLDNEGNLVDPLPENYPLLTVRYKGTSTNKDNYVKGYGKYVDSQKIAKINALESALKKYNKDVKGKDRLTMEDVMLTEDEYNEVCAELALGKYINYDKTYKGKTTLDDAYNKMINMSIVFDAANAKSKGNKDLSVEKFYKFTASIRGDNVPNTGREKLSFFKSINDYPKTVTVENYQSTDFSRIKVSELINRMMWLDILSAKRVENYEGLPNKSSILERMRSGAVRARSRSNSPETVRRSPSPPRRSNESEEEEEESGSETEGEEESVESPRAGSGLAPRRRPTSRP